MFSMVLFQAGDAWNQTKPPDSWATYDLALDSVLQRDWPRALALLAEAETAFRAEGDAHGLWRALLGQALLHQHERAAALAVARGRAAFEAACATADGFAIGCVLWQIANLAIEQGDYRQAAVCLGQALQALDSLTMAGLFSVLAVAGQLCAEIERWQRALANGQVSRAVGESMIAQLRFDLAARLQQGVNAAARYVVDDSTAGQPRLLILLPESAALPGAAAGARRHSRLLRWWRRFTSAESAAPRAEPLPKPIVALLPALVEQAELQGEPSVPPPTLTVAVGAAPLPIADAPPALAQAPAEPAQHQSAHGAGLAIYCFGSFRVYLDDRPVEQWEGARARSILKYLVAQPAAAASKEVLAELFWPDSEPELARRNLHQTIYCLRQSFKRIAPELKVILFAADSYQISPGLTLWVDAREFSHKIDEARGLFGSGAVEQAMQAYAHATDLYSGEFLAEDRYEDWAEKLRPGYQTMFLEALHSLARFHLKNGDFSTTVLLCQRGLAHESCDEETHRMLMECYMAQGLRHMAVRQYQLYGEILKSEFDLAPSDELVAFYQQILSYTEK